MTFSGTFVDITIFSYVLFESQEKVIFEVINLSKVSFMNTSITRIRISDKSWWGNETDDRFKIIEERWLEKQVMGH